MGFQKEMHLRLENVFDLCYDSSNSNEMRWFCFSGRLMTMTKYNNTEIDMLHGPLAGKIVLFAIPLAASSILQQLFNAADIAVVGRFASAAAMAAAGSNAAVINLLVGLFTGLAIGANVVIANLVGADKRERIRDAVHTVIALALISGIFLTVVGFFLAPAILHLMGAPENVLKLAVVYLRIYFTGMPAIMIYNFGSAILRSKGDSRRPFLSLTLAGIVNVLLNLLFVIVFRLHVIGVALATVLSNLLCACLILYFLLHEEPEFRLDFHSLHLDRELLTRVVQVGLPAGLQGMVFSFSNVVIQSAVNSFGANCIAGMAASQYFDFMSYSLLNAFGQATVTFVSQNYGAGNEFRCRRVLQLSMLIGIGSDLVLIALMILFRNPLLHLFTTDEAVIPYALTRMIYVFSLHFLCGSYEIPAGALRGLNHSMVPALISVLGTCAFRLTYVFFIFPSHRSFINLIIVYPISWILTGTAMNIAYQIVRRRVFRQIRQA